MNIFKKLRQNRQLHLYKEVMRAKHRVDEANRDAIRAQMTIHGRPLYIGDGYNIIGPQYVELGDDCMWGPDAWVECRDDWKGQQFTPKLRIGNHFGMQRNCHIGCIDCIEIGDEVLLGSKVYITDHFHGEITKEALALPPERRPVCGKPVKIGNNCWIGDNVCIMPGVTLGDNVIVGANAVVTHSFPNNSVIAGVPAKIIRQL